MSDATSTPAPAAPSACCWCGMIHGLRCPTVKAIEYYPDGGIKRVEFLTWSDYLVPVRPQPYTSPIWSGKSGDFVS